MRRVARLLLSKTDSDDLARRQRKAVSDHRAGVLNVDRTWRNARKGKVMGRALRTLQRMAGARQRCMYCLDSHGTDIEHWRPKASYPGQMFAWDNMLLCCAECGRFKLDQFPVDGAGQPLLLDPTVDDPWRHLDFDPLTGQITAAFDATQLIFDCRGEKTAEVLHFAERDAMHDGYRRTWHRLAKVVRAALGSSTVHANRLCEELLHEDDHGLLPWCFSPRGRTEAPFSQLWSTHPTVFAACAATLCGALEPLATICPRTTPLDQ
jgi:uncharacterized protein (TIGR02646 family)